MQASMSASGSTTPSQTRRSARMATTETRFRPGRHADILQARPRANVDLRGRPSLRRILTAAAAAMSPRLG